MITIRATLARHTVIALVALAAAACVTACGTLGHRAGSAAAIAAVYYVSPSGSDAAAGTSPATAWRTLGRASFAILPPGTKLLLQGGKQFAGQLTLNARDAGNGSDPVVVGSYGAGMATILAGSGTGLFVYDTAGVDIEDLNLTGLPRPGATGSGISIYNDLPSGHRLDHVDISNVSVTGFVDGIAVGGRNSQSGFGDVDITDSKLTRNLDVGLETYGPAFNPKVPTYANQDVRVSRVIASQNHGDPGNRKTNTGNGIVFGSVSDGTISGSTADDNGGAGAASQGPAGIWTYDSTGVDIEHNISHDNQTPNRIDGDGFGLDQNMSNSVLQYNLSYGNDGAGYLVYSAQNDSAQKNNIVRDNISSCDVRDGNTFYGGISVIGLVKNATVYQNTVVMTTTPGGAPPLLRLGPALQGTAVRNNIFTTESGPIVEADSPLPPATVSLQGNDYHSVLGPWQIVWGPTTYLSLSSWSAATAQEMKAGQPTGLDDDPDLVGPVVDLRIASLTNTHVGAAFALKPGSPLIGAGQSNVPLQLPPPTNFSGNPESATHPDIGAE